MPIMFEDMETLIEDIRDDVRRMRALRDAAYQLALAATATAIYADDPAFKQKTDAVLTAIVARERSN